MESTHHLRGYPHSRKPPRRVCWSFWSRRRLVNQSQSAASSGSSSIDNTGPPGGVSHGLPGNHAAFHGALVAAMGMGILVHLWSVACLKMMGKAWAQDLGPLGTLEFHGQNGYNLGYPGVPCDFFSK